MFGDDDLLGSLTLLLGVFSAIAGYVFNLWQTQQNITSKRKLDDVKSRKGRVETQLKDLFGPLRMLDIACFQAVTPMAKFWGRADKELDYLIEQKIEPTLDSVPNCIKYLARKAAENPASKLAYDYRCAVPSLTRPTLDATVHGSGQLRAQQALA